MERFSKNREAIIQCLNETDIHPTAEWVYQQVRGVLPDISLGTVYRNLSQLKEKGLIRSMGVVAGEEHFDGKIFPHSHFICKSCGSIIDIKNISNYNEIVESVSEKSDFYISDMTFNGICFKCHEGTDN